MKQSILQFASGQIYYMCLGGTIIRCSASDAFDAEPIFQCNTRCHYIYGNLVSCVCVHAYFIVDPLAYDHSVLHPSWLVSSNG